MRNEEKRWLLRSSGCLIGLVAASSAGGVLGFLILVAIVILAYVIEIRLGFGKEND